MDQQKKKFSYHWIIFAIGFLMVFVALGFNSSIKSNYLKAITDQLDLKRSVFSLGDSIRFVSTAVLNIFFGALVARFGARKLVGAGFFSLMAYCLISACGTTYWHFYVASAFLGCGLAWTTTTIVGVIVEKWFTNGKGTIMGIILAANGLGGAAAEFIITPIIFGGKEPLAVEDYRWRLAYVITAIILLVVGFLAVTLIRNTPEEKGIEPLGKDAVAKKKRGANWVGFEMSDLKKKPFFYVAAVCIFVTGVVLHSFNGNAKPHMLDVGLDTNYVIVVFSIHSIVLTVAKILAGISFDKFGIRFTFGYCSVAAVVSLISLVLITPESIVTPWIYSILSSVALPLETIMIPLLVSEMFGKKCYSKIMGYFLGINTFGYALGSPLVNLFYDIFGDYRKIFFIFCFVLTANLVVIQFAFASAKKARIQYEASLKNE